MDNTQRSLSIGIVVLACSALFIAPPGMAQSPDVPVSLPPQASPSGVAVLVTRPVNCDAGQTLQRAIDTSNPGDTLSVSGTCNENVVVREEIRRITLDGQGSVTINSPDPSNFTVEIRGTGITVRGFTVTGGFRGINIGNGGTAVIDSNVIEGNGVGILLTRNASARIVNNTIRFNGTGGINISSDSSAFIGIFNPNDTLANPNTIVSNGGALPETVGEAAIIFDLSKPDALSVVLKQVLEDSALQSSLRAKGLIRAQGFSWQKTADLIWNTLNEL